MKISIDDLADVVAEELREYSEEVSEELKASVKKAAKGAVENLRANSPKDTGDYAKGWASRVAYEDAADIRAEVYNRTDYQLTHLLEDVHAKVGGGRVPGQPHIGPAADEAARRLEEDVQVRLERR